MAAEPQRQLGRLYLASELPIRTALRGAFEGILAYANSLREIVDDDPVRAIHRYRKSLRRSRAVLRLLRPCLDASAHEAILTSLRRITRPTSELRDVDVLVEISATIELDGPAAAVLRIVHEHLAAHQRTLLEECAAARVFAEGAAVLPRLTADVAEALDEAMIVEGLVAGFDATWRRSRKAGRRARKERTDDAIHRWRTRAKEVRYQLELLAETDIGPVESLRHSYERLARHLGWITDFIALRRYVDSHRSALDGSAGELIDRALSERIRLTFDDVADQTYDVRTRIRSLVSPSAHGS